MEQIDKINMKDWHKFVSYEFEHYDGDQSWSEYTTYYFTDSDSSIDSKKFIEEYENPLANIHTIEEVSPKDVVYDIEKIRNREAVGYGVNQAYGGGGYTIDVYDEEQWNQVLSDFEEDHFKCMEDISVNDIKTVDLENSKKIYDRDVLSIDLSKCDVEMKNFLLELRSSIYGLSNDKNSPDFKENPDNYAVHNSAEAVLQAIDDSDISGKFYDAYDESIGIKPQSI